MADTSCCQCGTCAECGYVRQQDRAQAVANPLHFAHAAVRQRLLDRIARIELNGRRPLAGLGTRDPGDPTIALLDAWAGVVHVLGWNGRRLHEDANFHQSEDSVAMSMQAQMLGYVPRLALAAQAVQGFMVDEFSDLAGPFAVPAGTRVATIPDSGELPLIFETDLAFEAHRAWNRIGPVRSHAPQQFAPGEQVAVLEGVVAGLMAGQGILLPDSIPPGGGPSVLFGRIAAIETVRIGNGTAAQTHVTLTGVERLQPVAADAIPAANEAIVLGTRAAVFGANAPDFALMPKQESVGAGLAAVSRSVGRVERIDVADNLQGIAAQDVQFAATEWSGFVVAAPGWPTSAGVFDLDGEYADALPGRLLLFDPGTPDSGSSAAPSMQARAQLGPIRFSQIRNRAGFGLSQKVTRVEVAGLDLSSTVTGLGVTNTRVRQSSIQIETRRLALVVPLRDEPLPRTGEEDRLLLVGEHALPPGRLVVVKGLSADPDTPEAMISEAATVASADVVEPGQTLVVFERPLTQRYMSASLGVHGNCTTASHAEGIPGGWEVLGSGTRGQDRPAFVLKQGPLAQLAAANERGYAPAIEVRVDQRRYEYRESLYGADPSERCYTVEATLGGRSRVRFAGPLPSGMNNVMAYYRIGGGAKGNVEAGRIVTILSPVLGIASSENLVRSEGGMDAESMDDIRRAAPRRVAALGRIVSRHDYEAFAAAFRGVGQARATELQDGMRAVVCLTIATSDMRSPQGGSLLVSDLTDAIEQYSPPWQKVRVEGFVEEPARLTAALKIDEVAFRRGDVEHAVRDLLASRFGRLSRRFGQPMRSSEILAAIHEVPGVIAARIDTLDGPSAVPGLSSLPASQPGIDSATGAFRPAGLLSLDAADITFTGMI